MALKTFNTDVTTAHGAMDCFIAHPESGGPHGAVILYMDVPGIRSELEDFACRIAAEGYVCVLPDLYYRGGRVRFDLAKLAAPDGQAELQRMFAEGSKLTNAMVISDTHGILQTLEAMPEAGAATGVIGYCMSGQFVLSVAGAFPDRIVAAASLYGTRMVTEEEDSPHLLIPQIAGEVYLGFAETDPYVEDFVVTRLQEELQTHQVRHVIDVFANTEHGFCFPERPAYVNEAAETVWERVFDMYARCLRV